MGLDPKSLNILLFTICPADMDTTVENKTSFAGVGGIIVPDTGTFRKISPVPILGFQHHREV